MFRTRNEARGTEPQELSIRWQCTWRRTAAILASLTIRGSSDVANVTEALHCKLRLEALATAKTIAERKVVQEDYPYLIPMLSDPSCDVIVESSTCTISPGSRWWSQRLLAPEMGPAQSTTAHFVL
jgi:hypothetical protein